MTEKATNIVGNNSQVVVYFRSYAGMIVTSETCIDGFTITGASENGMIILGAIGSTCSPTLSNLIFTGNSGAYNGNQRWGSLFY